MLVFGLCISDGILNGWLGGGRGHGACGRGNGNGVVMITPQWRSQHSTLAQEPKIHVPRPLIRFSCYQRGFFFTLDHF